MIDGVYIKPLQVFSDEKGKVMHMIRNDSDLFEKFGEIYFSLINPGVIKGWKNHKNATQHFTVPEGNIKLVLYDNRDDSSTRNEIQEVFLGLNNYCLIRIPPKIWYSFQAQGDNHALIANLTDHPHDPSESISINIIDKKIPYNWEISHK